MDAEFLGLRVKVIGTIVAHIKRVHCGVEHGRVGIVVGNHAAEGLSLIHI